MRRIATALVLLVLLLAACGGDASGTPTTTAATGSRGTIHISGGIAGIDETWMLAADGTVLGPEEYLGAMTSDDRARLEAAIDAAGFFDLDSEYLPDDQCCDRFLYELTVTRGGVTHSVTTLDGADAPEALFLLINTFLEVVRPEL
ncbi:MAG TPA: hypothetical protein DCY40_07790 [Actinobacteria bacterium]|nr:hypothetical protein [Actinomycetota bacterium]